LKNTKNFLATYTLREYQDRVVKKCVDFINDKVSFSKKLLISPVGSGKSLIIAAIANALKQEIIVLQPSKVLLKQNYEKYISYGNKASIFSASMGSKEIGHVTFATPLSLANYEGKIKAKVFLIDEAHLQSKHGSAMATFLKKLGANIKVIGFTATPVEVRQSFDLGSYLTLITSSRKNMFNSIIDIVQVSEILREGFWAKLVYDLRETDKSSLELNSLGSDFQDASINRFYEENDLESKIVKEIQVLREEGRKSILVFCNSINQAESLQKKVQGSTLIHSKLSDKEKDYNLSTFMNLEVDVMINVNMLSVGFDHPRLDAIIKGRPTNSFIIYYQQLGRLVRLHKDKENGKVVDFSGNIERFGKLEDLVFKFNGKKWFMFSGDRQLTDGQYEVKVGDKEFFKARDYNKLWFGKHSGKHLKDVPKDYLQWIVSDKYVPQNQDAIKLVSNVNHFLKYGKTK